jgi:hypothetical protein
MMIGIGTPISQSRRDRMAVSPGVVMATPAQGRRFLDAAWRARSNC